MPASRYTAVLLLERVLLLECVPLLTEAGKRPNVGLAGTALRKRPNVGLKET
jgi:hypothetical protein